MNRGSVVTVALQVAYGKPRPALIVQSDLFSALASVTILPITSDLRDAPLYRIEVSPTETNGLRKPSQIMVDKPQTIPRDKLGPVIGHIHDSTMISVNRAMALFLGFG